MGRIESLALDFCNGVYDHTVKDEVWPKVFRYLLENSSALSFSRDRIHTLWTVNGGHLRRKVSDDDLTVSVLTTFLPKYEGEGLTLYRGECKFLFDDNKIGFCWTPVEEVARMFASGLNSNESGGVLLKAYAPSRAIISSPNDHSVNQMEEHEYTCNPNLLEDLEVIKVFDKYPNRG
ncbi:MAG: hypothetical protein KZQ85_14720 [Candidatus Thiodiazotropha sp. (ex Myrtea sp. 'scaly one' KF741663)]|nr:hypothetical protein [Candidatus Thiodiazotropha sp. (ex Myrtea sp. 'scaly one' KF741663)]